MKQKQQEAEAVQKPEWEQELEQVMSDQAPKKKKKSFKGKKKFIILGVIVVIILLFLIVGGMTKGAGGLPVMTKKLEKQDVLNSLTIQGPVSGTNSVHVVSRLNAEILEILVKEGDQVEKDQVLAVIDDKDVQKEVELAQNAYDLALANKQEQQQQAEAGYEKARQNLVAAQKKLNRRSALIATGGISQVEIEEAQTEVNNANAELSTYTVKNGVPVAPESFELQVQQAKLSLDRKIEDLDNTKLKSPITGTVVRVNSKVGQFADTVEDDKPIFIIENLDALEMKINVSEYSIGKVSVGQKVTIRADILDGDTVEGEVITISPTGEEKGGGSTERVIPITIRIADEDTKLIAGITAKAEILLEEDMDTLAIPISALIQQDDGDYIAVVENQIVRLVPVIVGVESDIMISIKPVDDGILAEGMDYIVNPFTGITDGITVIPEEGQ